MGHLSLDALGARFPIFHKQGLAHAKIHAFEAGHGWFFWNFKTELEVNNLDRLGDAIQCAVLCLQKRNEYSSTVDQHPGVDPFRVPNIPRLRRLGEHDTCGGRYGPLINPAWQFLGLDLSVLDRLMLLYLYIISCDQ